MFRGWRVMCLVVGAVAIANLAFTEPPLAEVRSFGSSVEFSPTTWGHGFTLKVTAPDGAVVQKTLKEGAPSFDLSELKGPIVDGRYKYELRLIVSPSRQRDAAERRSTVAKTRIKVPSLSGSFLVSGGSIMSQGGVEPSSLSAPQGGLDAPDLEITEDLCVGAGCVSGEVYHAQATIKLKEADAGIQFEDTSTDVGWPTNDWLIHANDNTQGGAEYLGFRDLDAGTTPFKVEAAAPENSLLVDTLGFVGIGNPAPIWDLHIVHGDRPGVLLDQDTSLGWPPYTWLLAGFENAFFLEDTAGSGIWPFIVEAGAPDSSLFVKSDGKIGLGTYSPSYTVEVERTGVNSAVVVDRTDGATNYINATASFGNFGTVTDHPLRLAVNGTWQMRLNNDSSILMANTASLTAGGVWTNASSRALKKDIEDLSVEEAAAALADLAPVKFAYKVNSERHVGFIAEDVPDLVAGADRNGLSPMDVVAVLTRVVQRQEEIVQAQRQKLLEQETTIDQMLARISTLESR